MSEALFDPRPGALGFLEYDDGDDQGAACLLLFQETADTLPPVDTAGHLERPSADTGAGMGSPRVVADGFTGYARDFSGTQAVRFEDPYGATYLPQSVTVQAIVRWDRDAQAAAAVPGTIISRGLGTDTTQQRCFHVQLRADVAPGSGVVEMGWQEPGQPMTIYAGANFDHRAGWWLFTVTREFHSPSHIILRYWRNAELLATHDLSAGLPSLIAGGVATGKVVLIGAAGDGLGGYENYYRGEMDSLVVRPYAVTHEQVAALYQRLTVTQPQLHRAIIDLLPVGRLPSYADLQGNAQGIAKASAQPFALAQAQADELAESGLPTRCYGARLRQWETCLELPDVRDATIDNRRARVQAALRRELGLSAGALQQGLAPLFGLDPEDVEIITVTNLIEDDFADIDPLLWQELGNGTATPGSGLTLDAALGVDIRHTANLVNAKICRAPVADPLGATLIVKIESLSAPADTEVGFVLQAGADALWWTVRQVSVSQQSIGHRVLQANVLSSYTADVASVTLPVWLRLQTATDGSGTVSASYSTTGPHAGYSAPVVISFTNPLWVGLTLKADAVLGAQATAVLEDAVIWTPNADRPFYVYAYRDPLLPGSYDIAGARVQIDRQRAARDTASAGTVRALVCDDAFHGCGQAPLGGYE